MAGPTKDPGNRRILSSRSYPENFRVALAGWDTSISGVFLKFDNFGGAYPLKIGSHAKYFDQNQRKLSSDWNLKVECYVFTWKSPPNSKKMTAQTQKSIICLIYHVSTQFAAVYTRVSSVWNSHLSKSANSHISNGDLLTPITGD